jgi:hypothetical protein
MSRPPRLPSRDEIPEDEREDYDVIRAAADDMAQTFAGKRWATFATYYSRMLVNPPAARSLRKLGGAARKNEFVAGSQCYRPADHELADLVLSFDAGYWAFLAIHTPPAVAAGISVADIEALRDGREHRLDDDTRFVVQFIRAVADGSLSDEQWNRMEERLGSERGTFDYCVLILTLQFHLRMHHVLAVPAMPPEAFDELLDELRTGRYDFGSYDPAARSRAPR